MTMFPTSGSHIYRNDEGEVLGWDNESSYEPEYCGNCGGNHSEYNCPYDDFDEDAEEYDDDEDEDQALIFESVCNKCGETFNPDSREDLKHAGCGGHGKVLVEYYR